MTVMLRFQRVMHSVLTSRVILHLREANKKELDVSFLTTMADMQIEISEISDDFEMSEDIEHNYRVTDNYDLSGD